MAAESPIALIYGFDGSGYIETSIRAGIAVPSGQPGFMALGSDGTNTRYLKVSNTGVLIVDGSAVTQPVSGTFWQATQPVSIAATVAVSGPLTDTQLRASAVPVSVASLPLPSGAATEATLAGVLTTSAFQARIPVNGQAVMSASIPVVIASNQSAIPINDNAGSITVDTLQLPAALVSGRLDVNVGASTTIAVSQSGSWTVTANAGTNLNTSALALDATLAAMSLADNAAFTDGTTRVQPAGFILDEVAGTALTENDAAAARIDSKRAQVHVIEDATTRGQRLAITASNAAKVDGSAVTQPISAASLPLPTGAATETTLGTRLADATFTGRINTLGQKTMANSTPVVLSSDQSAIPASQSGTWTVQPGNTANTTAWRVEGQKTNNNAAPGANNVGTLPAVATASNPTYTEGNQVTLSTSLDGTLRVTSSSTASEEQTFTVIASAVTPGNNKSMLAIYNPTGSGYTLKLREFYLRNAATTAVTGVVANFELHRFASGSAPTGGTNLTTSIVAHDSNDSIPASMRASTGDTISGEIAAPLDLIRMSTDEWGPGTADVESYQQAISSYLPARAKRDGLLKPFFARPGEGLHMKFATNSTAGSIDVVFVFTKV